MKIRVTFGELLDTIYWDEFCDIYGYNPYFINEGAGDSSEEVIISKEEAERWGLL